MENSYRCNCGFTCRKSYYFLNHKNICNIDKINNLEIILQSYSNNSNEITNSLREWWNKYSDRIFMQKLYPKIGEYLQNILNPKILDIGFEDYNIINKDLLGNLSILYFQLEPFIENKKYKNDVLLECKVDEILKKYPEYEKYFNIIIDFGVLGAPSISKNWDEEQINEYIRNIYTALQDNGLYFLKIDLPYFEMPEYKLDFDKMIYPYFEPISFENYQNDLHIFRENTRRPNFSQRDQYKFFFLKKKKEINIISTLVFVAHPDDESIWCEEKLDNTTHVIVVFGYSKMGLETAKIRENELKNAMNITGSSYEIWNFNEKKMNIQPKTISAISKKIIKVLDEYKNIKTIYTHNEYGEYGHMDHIRMHQIMKKVLSEYYANKNSIPYIFQFYPNLNYNSDDRFENILWIKESERRKIILDCYKTQTMQKYRNIQLNFIPFIIDKNKKFLINN